MELITNGASVWVPVLFELSSADASTVPFQCGLGFLLRSVGNLWIAYVIVTTAWLVSHLLKGMTTSIVDPVVSSVR